MSRAGDLADALGDAPTLADADARREASDVQYATAREFMAQGKTKAAGVAVVIAQDLEAEADRLELLARRALMGAT